MNLNKKNVKKLFIILTMLMFCITIYKISITYALLQSETKSVIKKEIGKWNIKLNETDITNGLTQDIVIDNFAIDKNNNVKEGKIAPGVSGSLLLTLDPVDTQVSVRYDISLMDIEEEQIKLNSIEEITGNTKLIKTSQNTYTGIMNLSNITNKTAKSTIKIVVEWENDELNNISDTTIGTSKGYDLQIPISVHVEQYLGEEITEFKEQEV